MPSAIFPIGSLPIVANTTTLYSPPTKSSKSTPWAWSGMQPRTRRGKSILPCYWIFMPGKAIAKCLKCTRRIVDWATGCTGCTGCGDSGELCGSLTDDRVRQLEEIGFVWKTKATPNRDYTAAQKNSGADKTWEDYFELLLQYKQDHGHCKVPQLYQENRALGHWVHRMRKQYRLKMRGEVCGSLTDDRVRQLEEIGFVWKTKVTPNREYTAAQKNSHAGLAEEEEEEG